MPKSRTLQFVPLTQHLVQACSEFNERLGRAGAALSSVTCLVNRDRGMDPPAPMEVERYVGVDVDGQVRGSYSLRWQYLWLRGERLLGAHYGYPISEGVIDKHYAMLGVLVLLDAVKRCEYLYLLGAGGRTGSVFRVAEHVGFAIADVPFLFRVINGGRFLRKLPQMQSGLGRRLLATIGGATGLAQLATGLLHGASAISHRGSSSLRPSSSLTVDEVTTLAAAADEVRSRVHSQYTFCVVRDGAPVEPSFPLDRTDLHRLVVRHQGSIIGWSVVMREGLSRLHAYLGDIAPGLIVDAFGDTAYASEIVRAATAYLAAQGVDVVITNTSHEGWVSGYKRAGFIAWDSQFPLIVSHSLARRIGDLRAIMTRTHMSRADADGVHYLH
jgi:hypothetical protein